MRKKLQDIISKHKMKRHDADFLRSILEGYENAVNGGKPLVEGADKEESLDPAREERKAFFIATSNWIEDVSLKVAAIALVVVLVWAGIHIGEWYERNNNRSSDLGGACAQSIQQLEEKIDNPVPLNVYVNCDNGDLNSGVLAVKQRYTM